MEGGFQGLIRDLVVGGATPIPSEKLNTRNKLSWRKRRKMKGEGFAASLRGGVGLCLSWIRCRLHMTGSRESIRCFRREY